MTVEDVIDQLLARELGAPFLEHAWVTEPVVIRGEPGQFAALVEWQAVNDLIDSVQVEEPAFVVGKGGEMVRRSAYTRPTPGSAPGATSDRFDPIRLHSLLRSGATLQVEGADRFFPSLSRACERFERWFRARALCNVFLSYAGGGGTPMHWDAIDGFLLQVAGSRHWRVFEPARPNPLNPDAEFNDNHASSTAWEGELHDGDALYIPRGWWHAPQASPGEGVLSLHVTIGALPVTGVDLLLWLADQLRASDVFRRDLPRMASAEEQEARADALWGELSERWHDGILEEYLRSQDATAHVAGRASLPWALDGSLPDGDGWVLTAATARRIEPMTQGPTVVAEALGRRWTIDARATEFVTYVLDGHPVPIGELEKFASDDLPVADLRELVSTLIVEGLLVVRERPDHDPTPKSGGSLRWQRP